MTTPEDRNDPEPLKIAFVVDRFGGGGGGEAYVAHLARALTERGHQVKVFAREGTAEAEPFPVTVLDPSPLGKTATMIRFARRAARQARAEGYPLVHGTGKCLGVDVYNPHGGVEREWLRQNYASCDSPCYRAWVRCKRLASLRHHFVLWQQGRVFGPRGARAIVAISDRVRQDVETHHGPAPDRMTVIYNGVDLERFSPTRREELGPGLRDELGLAGDAVLLLHASHNFRLKGMTPLLEALAHLKTLAGDRPFLLAVAGRGRTGPRLRQARRLGVEDRVCFLGPRGDMDRLYAGCDVYVHPTFYDACSLVLFEAMAAGVPVVTTRANGAAWALDGTEGAVLDDPRDALGLAKALGRLFDDEVRRGAGRAARATAERFPLEENTDKMVALYRSLLRGSS